MNEQTVARVVGILFGAAGRQVSDAIIDAWAVALAETPDRDDEIYVAAELARAVNFATVAQFHGALRESRRRGRAALPPAEGESFPPLSHPANWRTFVKGARDEAARLGKPAPNLPDEAPAGVSLGQLVREMFRPPELPAPAGAEVLL